MKRKHPFAFPNDTLTSGYTHTIWLLLECMFLFLHICAFCRVWSRIHAHVQSEGEPGHSGMKESIPVENDTILVLGREHDCCGVIHYTKSSYSLNGKLTGSYLTFTFDPF